MWLLFFSFASLSGWAGVAAVPVYGDFGKVVDPGRADPVPPLGSAEVVAVLGSAAEKYLSNIYLPFVYTMKKFCGTFG